MGAGVDAGTGTVKRAGPGAETGIRKHISGPGLDWGRKGAKPGTGTAWAWIEATAAGVTEAGMG